MGSSVSEDPIASIVKVKQPIFFTLKLETSNSSEDIHDFQWSVLMVLLD